MKKVNIFLLIWDNNLKKNKITKKKDKTNKSQQAFVYMLSF